MNAIYICTYNLTLSLSLSLSLHTNKYTHTDCSTSLSGHVLVIYIVQAASLLCNVFMALEWK